MMCPVVLPIIALTPTDIRKGPVTPIWPQQGRHFVEISLSNLE
jgi:hypothetical protein